MALAVAALIVAAKTTWLLAGPDWRPVVLGIDPQVTELVLRNLFVAAFVSLVAVASVPGGRPGCTPLDVLGIRLPSNRFWTFTPPASVVGLAAIVGAARGGLALPVDRLAGIILGTALFEEVIFRGALQSMTASGRSELLRLAVPAFAFGCWHIADAIGDGSSHAGWGLPERALLVLGTVLLMTAVSRWILEPIRVRSGSIIGPWLLHAAVNGSFVVLGAGGR